MGSSPSNATGVTYAIRMIDRVVLAVAASTPIEFKAAISEAHLASVKCKARLGLSA